MENQSKLESILSFGGLSAGFIAVIAALSIYTCHYNTDSYRNRVQVITKERAKGLPAAEDVLPTAEEVYHTKLMEDLKRGYPKEDK